MVANLIYTSSVIAIEFGEQVEYEDSNENNVSEHNEFEIEYNIAYFSAWNSVFALRIPSGYERRIPFIRDEGARLGYAKILSYEELYEYFFDVGQVISKYAVTAFEDRFLLVLHWAMGSPGAAFRVESVSFEEGLDIELTVDLSRLAIPAVMDYGVIIFEIPTSQLEKSVSVSSNYSPFSIAAKPAPAEILPFQPRVWVDIYADLYPARVPELTLDEFPDTIFRCTSVELTATDTNGERALFPPRLSGAFVNIYLADLNGDGLPEFCATLDFGSGVPCWGIYVYDYAAGEQYRLIGFSDKGPPCYDCYLSMKDGQLIATQVEHLKPNVLPHYNNIVKAGSLAIIDEELVIIESSGEDSFYESEVEINNPDFVPGEVFVGFMEPYKGSFSNEEFPGLDVVEITDFYLSAYEKFKEFYGEDKNQDALNDLKNKAGTLYKLKLAEETKESVLNAIYILKQHPNVAYAEPNYITYPEEVAGATVTGAVKSYNPKNPTTIRLMRGEAVVYETVITGTAGSGQMEKTFAIKGVASGTYSMQVCKQGHTDYTVTDIVVDNTDIDLAQDNCPEVRLMTLRCGDINGDGLINDNDLTSLWSLSNYNMKTEYAANPLCDLNGDGMINDVDLTILWMASNYNRGEVTVLR